MFTREDGEPVRDFRGSWAKVCEESRVPDLLFHDLRRAGVAEGVIMKIGGWKTRSVFERYNIVDQRDIRQAVARMEPSANDPYYDPYSSKQQQSVTLENSRKPQ